MTDESAEQPGGGVPGEPAGVVPDGELADDEWHRLHPATPLLRGGLLLIAIGGFLFAQFRERLLDFAIGIADGRGQRGGGDRDRDPLDWLINSGYVPLALGVLVLLVVIVVLLFWLSWRMHTYRVTAELVEVRSGVLFRTHRKARLDRIQGVDIARPVIARLLGAAKFEVQVAGDDANVKLDYLRSRDADELRLEILRLASGVQAAKRAPGGAGAGAVRGAGADGPGVGGVAPGSAAGSASARLSGFVDDRVQEFLAPELDPNAAPPQSVVEMSAKRLIGSTIVSDATLWLLVLIAGSIVAVAITDAWWILFTTVPLVLAFGSVQVRKVIKFLRYTIASTEHGIRVGYGVLATANETIPPGRIHSISVNQSLIWRPFGWWHIRINRAARSGHGSNGNGQQQQNAVVLPVGSRDDALRVLHLLLPGHDADELTPVLASGFERDRGAGDFTTSPRRAAVLRWFSWRRNGFGYLSDAVLLRRGAIWRELVIVPFARVQSVAASQGPLTRALRLGVVDVHTVQGPISARLGALDVRDAESLFSRLAASAVTAAAGDTSHRWGVAAAAGTPPLVIDPAAVPARTESADLAAQLAGRAGSADPAVQLAGRAGSADPAAPVAPVAPAAPAVVSPPTPSTASSPATSSQFRTESDATQDSAADSGGYRPDQASNPELRSSVADDVDPEERA